MRRIIFIALLLMPFLSEAQILRAQPNYRPIAAPPSAQYILDSVPAKAAWGLTKLKSTATYAVRVRRSSDNAEQDIGFSGGNFDESAFSSFVGGGSGYIKTWYDQTGNGYDFTQSTNANQPLIVLNAVGSNELADFDGTDLFSQSNFMGSATSGTYFQVVRIDAQPAATDPKTGAPFMARGAASPYPDGHYPYLDNNIYECFGTNVRKSYSATSLTMTNLHLYSAFSAASDYRAYFNNSSIYSTGTNTVQFSTDIKIGSQDGSYRFNGQVGTIIIFDSALSTGDRNQVSAALNLKYTIY